MRVAFSSAGGWCFSGWRVGILETCTVLEKWNVSKVIWGLYVWAYEISKLAGDSSVVYHAGERQFYSCWWSTSWVWNFVVLVRDTYAGGLSSINVRMEYLFAFQVWCCELCVENRWGGGRKHYFANFFVLWGCFNCRWVKVGGMGQKVSFGASSSCIFLFLFFFFFYELFRLNLGAWAVSVFCSPLWRTKKKQLVFQDLFGELLNSHLHNLAMSLQLLQ